MKILLTGANGYIGMRLLPSLLEQGHCVYCCVRDLTCFPIDTLKQPRLEVVEADLLKSELTKHLPTDLHVPFYLIQ